ncbi:prepilin peptidase [Dongia sp.]|uniref:A24 family peptidase n=1 Tax=Dongia sp. TaxID=1977262 RepID=UPI0035B1E878
MLEIGVATCEILLVGLLVTGATFDIVQFRLPNWLTLATALVAIAWVLLAEPMVSAGVWHLLAGLLVLAVGLLAYRFSMIGGGDAKWIAALAIWVGFGFSLGRFLVLIAIFGGILGLVVLGLARIWPAYGMHEGKRHLPYGVAIALAGFDFWLRHGLLGKPLMALAFPS